MKSSNVSHNSLLPPTATTASHNNPAISESGMPQSFAILHPATQ